MGTDTEEMFQGKFITFEGTEGVGKTTQIQLAEKYLKTKNIQCLVTREPGGTTLGENIRNLLLNKSHSNMEPMSELLLMFAARAQHLEEVIFPALKNNTWVLCDRFTDASYAYQGGGRGIPYTSIKRIADVVQDRFNSDLTILLSGDVEAGMSRVAKRGEKDRFELEKIEFYERIRHHYLKLAKSDPQRIAVIDADQSIDKVALSIQAAMQKRLAELIS